MIQPLMYLQLDNIPMFHGAYSVINVSHDISPNKMNTRVRAVRKSKYSVPIVTDSTTFLPLDLNKNLNVPSEVTVVGAGDITDPVISNNTVLGYVNPVEGVINITSGFGLRRGRQHDGIDIGVPSGTEVKSSWSGIVNRRENEKGYGLYVIIDHSNGQNIPFDDGYYYYTLYAHLKEIRINDGEQVKLGQKFGFSGGGKNDPGRGNSERPHLHYEIRRSLDRLRNPKFEFFDLQGSNILNPSKFITNVNSSVASNENPDHGELSNIV
jgi:murein DD-endopeptidase MepM/ murein hydrolase activator NlpD